MDDELEASFLEGDARPTLAKYIPLAEMQNRLVTQDDRTPIIFITAFPQADIRRRALDAGAICFLSKPFDGNTLVKCIEAALGGESPPAICC